MHTLHSLWHIVKHTNWISLYLFAIKCMLIKLDSFSAHNLRPYQTDWHEFVPKRLWWQIKMLGKLFIKKTSETRWKERERKRGKVSAGRKCCGAQYERKLWCRKQLKRTGFDYRLLKWFFVVLLCKGDNRLLCFYLKNLWGHCIKATELSLTLTYKCLALDPTLI